MLFFHSTFPVWNNNYIKHKILKESFLIFVSSEEEGEKIKNSIEIFSGKDKVNYIPKLALNPYEFIPQPMRIKFNILKSFYLFYEKKAPFLIINASFLPFPFPNLKAMKYKVNEEIDYDKFLENLNDYSYIRVPQVQEVGEYSIRGSIVDVFSPLYEKPLRFEILVDKINSLRFFDEESQKSIENIKEAEIISLDFNLKSLIYEKKDFFERRITGLGGKKLIENPHFHSIFSLFSLEKKKRRERV